MVNYFYLKMKPKPKIQMYTFINQDVYGNSWSYGFIDVSRIFIFRRRMRSI